MTGRQGRRIDEAIEVEIRRRARLGESAAAIERALENDKRYRDRVPSHKTVATYANKERAARGDEVWPGVRPDQPVAQNVAALDCLPAIVALSFGRVRTLTNLEVQWLTHIMAIRPDLEPVAAWELVRFYLAHVDEGSSTAAFDMFLAYAPWRGEDERQNYEEAIAAGWIERAPVQFAALIPSGLLQAGLRHRRFRKRPARMRINSTVLRVEEELYGPYVDEVLEAGDVDQPGHGQVTDEPTP